MRCRTRSGSTGPTPSRGSSTPSWPTPRCPPVSSARLRPTPAALAPAHGAGFIPAQVVRALGGALLANAMFRLPAFEASTKTRPSGPLWLAEVVDTFGLIVIIFGVVRSGRSSAAPFAVGAYIGGAYF